MKKKKTMLHRSIKHYWMQFITAGATLCACATSVCDSITNGEIRWCGLIFAGVSLVLTGVSIHLNCVTRKEYYSSEAVNKVAKSVLKATQNANETKARNVLQPTYGEVPFWRSFNYVDNVLTYDVHGQIRELLLNMKASILEMNPHLTSDTLSVDLIYCYPNNEYSGSLPINDSRGNSNDVLRWKMITSGNTSQMNTNVHNYLTQLDSFYTHLSTRSYAYINDKSQAEKCYNMNGKDAEYGSQNGSIVGLALEIRNDEPEEIFVKAFLTVSTYGTRLWNEGDAMDEETFKKIFKVHVIDSWRYYLETELAQMYVRHEIRNGRMCQFTGLRAGCNKKSCGVCVECGKCRTMKERKKAIKDLRLEVLEKGIQCADKNNCFERSIKSKLMEEKHSEHARTIEITKI